MALFLFWIVKGAVLDGESRWDGTRSFCPWECSPRSSWPNSPSASPRIRMTRVTGVAVFRLRDAVLPYRADTAARRSGAQPGAHFLGLRSRARRLRAAAGHLLERQLYWMRQPRSGGWIYGPYVNHNHYAGLMEMLVPIPLIRFSDAAGASQSPRRGCRNRGGDGGNNFSLRLARRA